MIEIRDSVRSDADELSKSLRPGDRAEAEHLGLNPDNAIHYAYDYSVYRKTALINNKIAAMWGIGGDLFGHIGRPYLITGTIVDQITPLQFARIYKQEVAAMRNFFPSLENYVDATYNGAVRMLQIAGFDLTGPVYLGPNDHPFYKFSMVNE